jgi:hypothetical protein
MASQAAGSFLNVLASASHLLFPDDNHRRFQPKLFRGIEEISFFFALIETPGEDFVVSISPWKMQQKEKLGRVYIVYLERGQFAVDILRSLCFVDRAL